MKKGKILALALAAGITFMGAGYASWSDTVNINATVSTGKLATSIMAEGDNGSSVTIENNTKNNEGVATATLDTTTDNLAILTFNNLYPGVEGNAVIKIQNDSTIPVKFTKKLIQFPGADKCDELEFTAALYKADGTKIVDLDEEFTSADIAKDQNVEIRINVKLPIGATGSKGIENLEFKINTTVKQFNQ